MSTDEHKALEKREARREARLKAAMIVMMTAMLVGATTLLLARDDLMGGTTAGAILLAAVAAVALGAGAVALGAAPGEDARRLNAAGGRRDREQRARTGQLIALPASSLFLIVIASLNAQRMLDGERTLTAILPATMGALFVLLVPMMVMGWDGGARKLRKFLDDELTRAYRDQAVKTGFWVLLAAATTIYLVGLWRPEDAVTALPFALWAGGAAAALRFAQLHRRAEREMADDG